MRCFAVLPVLAFVLGASATDSRRNAVIPHGQKLAKFCGAWESGCKAYAEKNYKRNIVEKVTPNCEHNPSSTKLATVECLVSVGKPIAETLDETKRYAKFAHVKLQ